MDITMFSALKNKSFKSMWIGQSFSRMGDQISLAIMPIVILCSTGSLIQMGIVSSFKIIPQIVLLPFMGAIVDKVPRVNAVLISDFINFFLLLSLGLILTTKGNHLMAIYIYSIISGTISSMFSPAYASLKAQMIQPELRQQSNALVQMTEQLSILAGPAIGAAIISIFSAPIGIMLDASTFGASFVAMIFVKKTFQESKPRTTAEFGFLKSITEGFIFIKENVWLRTTLSLFTCLNLFTSGVVTILIPWLVVKHLGLPDYTYGLGYSFSAMGCIATTFVFGNKKIEHHRGVKMYCAIVAYGMSLLGLGFIQSAFGLYLLSFLRGFSKTFFMLNSSTIMQEIVPKEKFGRVSSLDSLSSILMMPVGYMLAGWAQVKYGGVQTILAMSAIVIALPILALIFTKVRYFD